MTENTAPIIPTTTTNNTTMTITPPNIPPDNINNSEYQRSYSWKLPMVTIHKPKERTKSEYQREFTWKNDTPSPTPSPAPVAPSPIPQDSLTACNTPEPVRQNSKTTNAITNNAIDYIGSKLTDLNITGNSNSSNGNINRHEEFTLVEKNFSTNNSAATDKWKDGLRSKNTSEPRQLTLASSLDPQTKKIVALEANRLSKKSRSYSMYSLHDQLKVAETANDLSNPFVTEYKSEFVNWKEYGTAVREDIVANKKGQIANHTLKRRGSWSAPSLPAPLKWLEGLNLDIGPREKLKPTITDAKSIRGTNNTTDPSSLKRSNTSAEFRDYHHGEKRPTTSAGFRDSYYDEKRPTTSAGFRDSYYDEKRPTTSAGYRDSYYDEKRPTTSAGLRDSYYDEKRPTTSAGFRDSYYDEKRPTTSAGFRDHYHDEQRPTTSMDSYGYPRPMTSSELRDYRNDDYYNSKHNSNLEYSTSRKNRNSSPLRSSTTIGHYDDREHSNSNRRDYDYYDDHKYDNRKYDDRKREDVYESGYNDRRRESGYDYHDSKYSGRVLQNFDQKHYNPNHSRNHSYSSSNKGSIHDEPPSYLDATRHRSSVSSISSVSTPSSPATPNGYDISDSRWRRNNGLDPRIYKEQNYSPSIISKSSSGSHHKYWPLEDDREKYYPSPLSPSRNKFYIDDDEDEHFSSKRQSRDYKPLNSSAMKSSVISYDSRSTSPSYDGYGSSRRQPFYSSRPPSRATSISSHGTSIEEDSAILTDMLKEADMMTLKNLTDQMSVFKYRGDLGFDQKEKINSGRSTPAVTAAGKRSSLGGGQKKPTTTATTKTGIKAKTTTTTKAPTKAPTKTPTKAPTRTPTKPGVKTTTITTKGTKTSSTPTIPPNKKKGHRPTSSLASVSSISTTSSYREAYQDYTRPPPTNFSAAREALNRARMKVEEMLEIVSNGGSLD